jgi:hypothetical protein
MSGVEAKGVSRRINHPRWTKIIAPTKEIILAKINRRIRSISSLRKMIFGGFTTRIVALSNVLQEFYDAHRPT